MSIYTPEISPPVREKERRRLPIVRIVLACLLLLALYRGAGDDPSSPPPPEEEIRTEEINREGEPLQEGEEGDNPTAEEVAPPPPREMTPSFREIFLSRQPDPALGDSLLDVLTSQNPYGAVYLMVDGENGRILAWGEQNNFEPLSAPSGLSKSNFPAASLAKIVTAATALESNRYSNHTEIPAIGSSVTLYRNQLAVPKNYRGRMVTLESAFASSMNPSMGIVGQSLGEERLLQTAERFGFNRAFSAGIPEMSLFSTNGDRFGIAEAASGFTNGITLSPLLAAAMVRAVLTGAIPEIPWSPLIGADATPAVPVKLGGEPFSENTYYGLRRMFEATIQKGSARSPFRNKRVFYPYNRERLRVGGKTGTKDDGNLRYEWFAGYALDRKNTNKSVVLVCLHMNELKGTRASVPAQAAALLLNHWARKYLEW